MKSAGISLLVALMTLTTPAAQAQQMPERQEMMKRFDQMDHLMDEAGKSRGAARERHVHRHMQMMHEMMQSMHGMMGGGMGAMGQGGRMGSSGHGPGGMAQMEPGGQTDRGGHGPGGRMGGSVDQQMQHMRDRMDMMQRMIEQMQKQHELMLKNDGKDKG